MAANPIATDPDATHAECPRELIDRLREALGDRSVLTEPTELLVYESDALAHHRASPDAVVFPRTTEDVQQIVRLCNEYGVPFLPRGAGTGLSGGAVPNLGGIMIEMARMNRVLEVDYENRVAVVQAGVTNLQLSDISTPHGYYYAPDPSSQAACTIGGNVAENAGGPHCLKYGVTLNHVYGAKVVLHDGEVVDLGGSGSDQVGYDLLAVFIGSEGTMGIVTEVALKLERTPQGVRTLLAIYQSPTAACQAVSDIIADGIIPAALEMMDKRTIGTIEASVLAAGYPTDAEAVIVIELDGLEPSLDDQAERVTEICTKNGAQSVKLAADDAERLKLWAGRKSAFGAVGRLRPDVFVQDAVVPRRLLAEVLGKIYEICDRNGVRVSNVFHAGDGNLHPNVPFDNRDPEEVGRVLKTMKEVMTVCVETGGSITGEHGVGADKAVYMDLIYSAESLEAMAAVRDVWNPRGLLNPGKVLPERFDRLASAKSATGSGDVAA